jgi:methionyl-tRNA formyltransferase
MLDLPIDDLPRIILFINGARGKRVYESIENLSRVVGFVYQDKSFNLGIETTFPIFCYDGKNTLELSEFVISLKPKLCIVAGFSHVLSPKIIEIPEHGFWNLHAGRVPKYRGGSPLNWQMINGEKYAGISILKMTSGIDDGSVLGSAEIKVMNEDTILDLHNKVNNLFPELLIPLILDINRSGLQAKAQDSLKANYWHQRNEADGNIDWWGLNSDQIFNFIRAITKPYPGAFGYLSSHQKIRIWKVKVDSIPIRGVPGRVVKLADGFHVPCGKGGSVLFLEFDAQSPLRNGDRFQQCNFAIENW